MSLPIGTPMPALEGATGWLGGSLTPDELTGNPVLVQFWAVSCPICKRNMPALQQLTETYSEQGLLLVSVHMPRGEADMDVAKVQTAMEEMTLTGPCAIDNEHAIGDLFQTGGAWPSYFFFDAQGKLRSRAAGALGLTMAENSLKRLLTSENTTPTGANV